MTDALCIYLSLNQLLLGKKVKELPSLALEYLKRENLVDAYGKALDVRRVTVNDAEKIFINLLRTPDYAFNVSKGNSAPLTLANVATLVRENNYDPDTCAHWAAYLITDFRDSTTGEVYVADSHLYVTPKFMDEYPDLEVSMNKAFSLFCWGTDSVTSRKMQQVHDLYKMVVIDGDTVLTTKAFSSLLRGFVTAQLSPVDAGAYMLELSDLAVTLNTTQALCYWGDYARETVRIVVPRGTSDVTVVLGVLPIDEFIKILGQDPRAFADVCAKGQKLVFKRDINLAG